MECLPVHVGTYSPEVWVEREEAQGRGWAQREARPPLADPGLDWARSLLEPRWLGDDCLECVAALEPSIFHQRGAEELDRFLSGAGARGETAVMVSLIGRGDNQDEHTSLFNGHSLTFGVDDGQVVAAPLGRGATVRIADGLGGADHDLAVRLMNQRRVLNWARLTLTHYESVRGTGQYERHNPRGTLEPILVTPVGEVVVGAWVIDGQRRYLLPTGTSWDMVVDWLSAKALPELVPGAIQRLRAHSVVPPELLSGAEAQVAQEIADLEARYSRERLALDARAAVHAKQGQAMRDGLLFGTDKALEAAVARVLEWAGIQVVDVDAMLGKSDSADLLCTYQGRTVLVEVKSSGGRAGEGIYAKLVTHLELWPRLVPKKPVDGGVLVVNHECRKEPGARSVKAFTRAAFVQGALHPIVTSMELFEAWRAGDKRRVRALVMGAPSEGEAPVLDLGQRRVWWRRVMGLAGG